MIHCRICNSSQHKHLYSIPLPENTHKTEQHQLNIYQCNSCNLVFSGLKLDRGVMADLYGAHYFEDETSVIAVDKTAVTEYYRRTLSWLGTLFPDRGSLLDVGCGCGDYLKLAREQGWRVTGLDISPYAARVASQNTGAQIFTGTLTEAGYSPESFDVVTAWDFIEHLDSPGSFAAAAKQVLKPNGILALRTPNQNSLFHWLADIAYKTGYSYPAIQLYHLDHLSYFTQETLTSLLTKTGFKVEKVEHEDLTIYDKRFRGWKRAAILCCYLLAELLHRRHAMIIYAMKSDTR